MATSAVMHPKPIGFIPFILGITFLFISLQRCGIIPWHRNEVNFFLGAIWLILAAICFIAARITRIVWEGLCPYCGYRKVTIIGYPSATNCGECKQRIVRKGATFFRLDEL